VLSPHDTDRPDHERRLDVGLGHTHAARRTRKPFDISLSVDLAFACPLREALNTRQKYSKWYDTPISGTRKLAVDQAKLPSVAPIHHRRDGESSVQAVHVFILNAEPTRRAGRHRRRGSLPACRAARGSRRPRHVHTLFTCQTARIANATLPGHFTFRAAGLPFPFFPFPRNEGDGAPGGAGPSYVGPCGPAGPPRA
jgi:hypothetical protein